MISKPTLETWKLWGTPSPGDKAAVPRLIASHLEAYDEIGRLRAGMQAMLDALAAIDSGDFDEAIKRVCDMRPLR